jgi:hypothetical protein
VAQSALLAQAKPLETHFPPKHKGEKPQSMSVWHSQKPLFTSEPPKQRLVPPHSALVLQKVDTSVTPPQLSYPLGQSLWVLHAGEQ